MRISDWSSDVCSSDLARGSAGVQYRNSLDYLIGQTSEVTTLAREGVSAQAYDRLLQGKARSEERRVGKECVSTCRSRWSSYHYKQKIIRITKIVASLLL